MRPLKFENLPFAAYFFVLCSAGSATLLAEMSSGNHIALTRGHSGGMRMMMPLRPQIAGEANDRNQARECDIEVHSLQTAIMNRNETEQRKNRRFFRVVEVPKERASEAPYQREYIPTNRNKKRIDRLRADQMARLIEIMKERQLQKREMVPEKRVIILPESEMQKHRFRAENWRDAGIRGDAEMSDTPSFDAFTQD